LEWYQTMKMTREERVTATLNCEPTDRPPIYDLIRNDAAIEYFARQPIDMRSPERAVYAAYSAFADATKSSVRMPRIPGETIVIEGEEYVTQRWTEWKKREPSYDRRNTEERVASQIKTLRQRRRELDRVVGHYIDDLNNKQAALADTVVFPNLPNTGCGLYSAYLFCGGVESFSYFMYDSPDLAEELIFENLSYTTDFLDRLPSDFAPPAVIVAEDIGGRNGPMFSPKYLSKTLYPGLKQVAKKCHERRTRLILHSDGDLNLVIDDLVDCGIDGLHPLESLAGMSVSDLRKRYPKLVLLGGIDCSQLLPFASAEDVAAAVMCNVKAAGYGYFVGSSSEINNEVPL
jgi:uroporphyrinogen decarboxylase